LHVNLISKESRKTLLLENIRYEKVDWLLVDCLKVAARQGKEGFGKGKAPLAASVLRAFTAFTFPNKLLPPINKMRSRGECKFQHHSFGGGPICIAPANPRPICNHPMNEFLPINCPLSPLFLFAVLPFPFVPRFHSFNHL
jgi:hypothetical protein